MKLTTVRELFADPAAYLSREITLGGWIRTVRDSKNFGFIELNDGSCFKNLQLVLDASMDGYETAIHYNVGAAIIVTGTLVESPGAKQPYELRVSSVTLEGASDPSYPLQKKRHSVEFMREIAHLRPRANLYNAAFRVRSEAAFAIHSFFHGRGFVYAHTPLITASDCEGAGEMFRVTTLDLDNVPRTEDGAVDYSQDFFGKSANLTVSGQLNAETFALAYGKTYTFGPTFRAEKSYTARHAAEFWMIEPEIAFADLDDDMQLAEDMLKYVIRHVLDTCGAEIDFFTQFLDKELRGRLEKLVDSTFTRLDYTDAVAELEKVRDRFEYPVYWGCDLQSEHERYLTEQVVGGPTFLINYPKEIKAFYMRLNDDGKTVAAADLLVPGIGELIGGSQREERIDVLKARMAECGLDEKDYWWYLDLRRYGGTRHAGFGLGFERLIMYLTSISNIRDVLPFPRTTKSAEF
ncbi:MAG: asparagine--tRNA ligase [Eubacteriales bacterium]|nr:asparagine--tRNA ligase [Eubacteriales bacterium]MDY5015899.1 asparagine--tRNA ligase [Eubacteriales bacterium]